MGTPDLSQITNVINASSLPEAFWQRVQQARSATVYVSPVSGTEPIRWARVSYDEVGRKVARLARYLRAHGIGPGERVAILSGTRPEWCISEMAILSLGAVSVSIYQSLPALDAGYILYDSGANFVIAENQEQVNKLLALTTAPCRIPAREEFKESEVRISITRILTIEEVEPHPLCTSIPSILNDTSIEDRPVDVPRGLTRESLASLVYTSGTTGPAKGVMQKHGNRLANVYQATVATIFPLDSRLFLYLPLAHSFARLIQDIGLLTPAEMAFPSVADSKSSRIDLSRVANEIREASAGVIPSVPRLFEKMRAGLKSAAGAATPRGLLLRTCISAAGKVYRSKHEGTTCDPMTRALHLLMTPIRRKIRLQLFGSAFSHAVSGGAKLDPEVNRFFDSLGIMICEGYGLTETCVATHVNLLNRRRIGSVGPAFINVEVKINAADGEILLRGPNVTSGYWNRPQSTSESWNPDGWFHTGDIGHVDADGFLYITDRKKDLIVTAGGKKVAPQAIEGKFKSYHLISYVVLCGEGKPYCTLLVTLNEAELRLHLSRATDDLRPLHDDPEVIALVRVEVDRINATLATFEAIKDFRILSEDFTIENGLLTPTLKVKRKMVIQRFGSVVEEMYGSK